MLENVGYEAVVGSPNAPYINNTLIPRGTSYTQSKRHQASKPAELLALFSGSTQGVTDDESVNDPVAPNGPFSTANLYTRLHAKGYSIKGFMDSMPSAGYLGCKYYPYAAKHNPFIFLYQCPDYDMGALHTSGKLAEPRLDHRPT